MRTLLSLLTLALLVGCAHRADVPGGASAAEPIMVAILWHQHQPHYLQDETGEYAYPWVRVHATKDYFDMVAILEQHPEIRFTVNLTPVLINQIEDLIARWEAGEPTDAFVRHTLIDADDLTDAEKRFLWTHFYSLNWDRILERFPRYRQLRDMRPDLGDEASVQAALRAWSPQDFRDLQFLFNLGWMDPGFEDGAALPDGSVITTGAFVEQGRGFTEDQKRILIDMHFAVLRAVLPVHREFLERGQIEVTTTPFYHPIMPLIHDTQSMREAMPNAPMPDARFQRPEDVDRHLALAVEQYERIFAAEPRGMWPSEGSVSQAVLPLMADHGIAWFATDVQVLQRSIGVADPPAAQRFTLWECDAGGEPIAGIFRDTGLSDRIGFVYGGWDGTEAAEDFVGILRSIRAAVAAESDRPASQHVIPIILDGENCWEYYERDGIEFLNTLYTLLVDDPLLQPVTVSEAIAQSGDLPRVERLHAGSWIAADFSTWIGEPEENRAWELLAAARAAFDTAEFAGEADRGRAMELLLIAEGSDWFWWYGADQTVDNEQSFDEAFRGTLKQAYQAMGIAPPSALDEPIMQGAGAAAGGGVMAVGERE